MQSSLIGKIEKAKRYAEERATRIQFTSLSVNFKGDNDDHRVELRDGAWHCTCDFFRGWGLCCHTMALEKVLDGTLPPAIADHSKVLEPELARA
jgi:hypothetical protein